MQAVSSSVKALVKVHLHCHLEGTLREATFLELARRHGVPLTYGRQEEGSAYDFSGFEEFLLTFAAVSRSLAQPSDYARLAAEFVQGAIEQNVRYGELFISPPVWRFFHPDLNLRACVRAIRQAFDAHRDRIELHLIVDLTRNFGVQSAMQAARFAVECADLGVIGVGLGGDEARFPPGLFVAPFAFARRNGLHAVAHGGEAAGAQSVRDAIELLGAERIGHGIRALEDASVVDLLVRCRIPLEICPTSNALTGAVEPSHPHPLLELDAAGAIVTIDADDPALFRTSITAEYAYVERLAGEPALRRYVANAIDGSFASAQRKAALHLELSPR